ncbi:MAG: hypothetical protein ACM3XN_04860 [Chloroflexota bacterium]
MARIMLDLRNIIDHDDIRHVRDVVERIGEGEELTVIVEREDATQTDPIFGILDEYGFDYQPKSIGAEGYAINARKRRPVH